ncbi:MAG: lipoprotein transmembrane [Betaproteobacteria bacterium]|nr:MAG: lipoprotein transmembrane [Betaproteobacteria bacterium]TAG46352.1 MAG: lipoprotein transmembrane [Betaproteobacteria bacterium]
MKVVFRWAVAGLCAAGFLFQTDAAEVSGVKVEDKIRVAGTELLLNGSGIRYAVGGLVRVYVASLYLPQKRASGAEIAALKGPRRVHINLLRDINANDFSKGLMAGMRANLSPAEQQKHFDSLIRLGSIFGQVPSMKKGETLSIDMIPGTGTILSANGKRVGEVFPDEAFWHALLQIWIGPKPIEESLKPVLLGVTASNDNTVRNENRF